MSKEYLLMMLSYFVQTILIEGVILLVGLSRRHSIGRRLFAGVWLTACTYPLLWLVLPTIISMQQHRALYLIVGETFVPIAECAIFWFTFDRGRATQREVIRDMLVIAVANLASFGLGEWMHG